MTAGGGSVLRPGDSVTFDGGEHQVVALAGTAVRLRSADGTDSVVLASYLMAAPDFAVTGTEPLPEMEPFGLLETLPEPARAAAVQWQRHVVEVETGLPPGAEPGTPTRPEYDPLSRTVVERAQAKADELGVSLRTVMDKRSFHEHTPGTLTSLSDYLFHRTGGMIGSLSQLIRGAAVLVIEDGSETITEDRLELVPTDFAAEQSQKLTAPAKATGRRRRAA